MRRSAISLVGDEFDAFAVYEPEGNQVTQFELPYPSPAGYGHDLLIVAHADDFQRGLRCFRFLDHMGPGTGLDEALKVCADRVPSGSRYKKRVKRQCSLAAQLEAARGNR